MGWVSKENMMEYYSATKKNPEGNSAIWGNMDEPGGDYTEWNKTKSNTVWSHLHIWNLIKPKLIETEQIGTCQGRGRREMGGGGQSVQTSTYKTTQFGGPNARHSDYS